MEIQASSYSFSTSSSAIDFKNPDESNERVLGIIKNAFEDLDPLNKKSLDSSRQFSILGTGIEKESSIKKENSPMLILKSMMKEFRSVESKQPLLLIIFMILMLLFLLMLLMMLKKNES